MLFKCEYLEAPAKRGSEHITADDIHLAARLFERVYRDRRVLVSIEPVEVEAFTACGLTDPRDPRPDSEMVGRHPMFRDHNCSRCKSGDRACVRGDPGRCEWPHARND
jgi:hypothetical protein